MYIGTYSSNDRLPSLIQRAAHPKLSPGAAFGKSHLLSETKVIKNGKPSTARWYFRSVSTVVDRFCAHLIGAPKLDKPGKNFFVKVKGISCKYFSFLAYQRSLQLLYETLDTLIEALTAFTVRQS